MRDDDPIRNHPPAPGHDGHVTHLADLVGRCVAYEQGAGDTRHGTILSANYSLAGETVLIVHPDSRRCEVPADTVLIGRPATWALEHLDAVDHGVHEATAVDEVARRRLAAAQARTIPVAESPAPAAPSYGW